MEMVQRRRLFLLVVAISVLGIGTTPSLGEDNPTDAGGSDTPPAAGSHTTGSSFVPAGTTPDDAEDPTDQTRSSATQEADDGVGLRETLDYVLRAEVFVEGLETAWAIAFIDAETALVTERPGRLRLIKNGVLVEDPIADTPRVLNSTHMWNQGGLLDVAVDPDYANNGWIYLSYSHPLPDTAFEKEPPSMTRVVRGRIRDHRWVDQQVVFEADPTHYTEVSWHFGGRMLIDNAGLLYISVGDRWTRELSRELDRPSGKIHRVQRDGAIPPGNPFKGQDATLESIYSYGHRNAQGLTLHPETGVLWQTEHGPRGGDELNIITSGSDYGWPIVSYGINYDGTILTPNTHAEGTKQPVYYWRPSTGVSGLAFYDSNAFPLWRGKLLVTGLATRDLRLLTIEGTRVQHEEVIYQTGGRPYEPVVGPDGAIYVVMDDPGRVIRLTMEREQRK